VPANDTSLRPYWTALTLLFIGARYLNENDLSGAITPFGQAARLLQNTPYKHALLVAQMTYAETLKKLHSSHLALVVFSVALEAANELRRKAALRKQPDKDFLYQRLRSRLEMSIAEIRSSAVPHMIPVITATAGVPLCTPGDDLPERDPVSQLEFDNGVYLLLDIKERSERNHKLNRTDRYFIVETHGDSMLGPTLQIRNGDRLLARWDPEWPRVGETKQVAIVQEKDSPPIAKHVRCESGRIVLLSANPLYGARVFSAQSNTLAMLGATVAILERK
jgi:hypothetical protein